MKNQKFSLKILFLSTITLATITTPIPFLLKTESNNLTKEKNLDIIPPKVNIEQDYKGDKRKIYDAFYNFYTNKIVEKIYTFIPNEIKKMNDLFKMINLNI